MHARKMTLAANDVINGATRLVDIAKKYHYANSNDFANDFSDFHGVSPIQASTKKMNYKFKSDYISNYQLLREHPIHTD